MAGEGGGKSDEDGYEILIMNDCLRKISARSSLTRQGVVLYLPTLSHFLIVNKTSLSLSPPDLVIVIEIEGVQ